MFYSTCANAIDMYVSQKSGNFLCKFATPAKILMFCCANRCKKCSNYDKLNSFSLQIAPKMPFIKADSVSTPYFLANSTASFIETL